MSGSQEGADYLVDCQIIWQEISNDLRKNNSFKRIALDIPYMRPSYIDSRFLAI
jgi:hypothetical protein